MSRILVTGNCENISYYEFCMILDDILGKRPTEFEEYVYPTQGVLNNYIHRYATYYSASEKEFDRDLIQNYRMANYVADSPDNTQGVHICIMDSLKEDSVNREYLFQALQDVPFRKNEFHLFWR